MRTAMLKIAASALLILILLRLAAMAIVFMLLLGTLKLMWD